MELPCKLREALTGLMSAIITVWAENKTIMLNQHVQHRGERSDDLLCGKKVTLDKSAKDEFE